VEPNVRFNVQTFDSRVFLFPNRRYVKVEGTRPRVGEWIENPETGLLVGKVLEVEALNGPDPDDWLDTRLASKWEVTIEMPWKSPPVISWLEDEMMPRMKEHKSAIENALFWGARGYYQSYKEQIFKGVTD
jgi:hypothetical protein